MSTRGIIGTANDAGFSGRYTHCDSYPSARGPQLLATYAELGSLEAVLDYAVRPGEEGYWSSYASPSGARTLHAHDYQTWRSDNGNSWADQDDDWDAEWAYLLAEDGFTVLQGDWSEKTGTAWKRIAFVAWGTTVVDGYWAELEVAA